MSDLSFFNRRKPYEKESLTISSSAVSGTASKINNVDSDGPVNFKASGAVVYVTTNSIFFTLDGTTPSATNGEVAYASERINIAGYQKVLGLRMLRATGTDAVVNITYYKE